MGHDHHHHHHHDHAHHHGSGSSLKTAFFLNTGFTVLEIIGGLWTGSVAILADAVHDLGDSLSLGFALWTDRVARKTGADSKHTYGHKRLTLVSSLVNALVLTAGSVAIITHALPKIWSPDPPNSLGMIGFALLGVLVNGLAVLSTRRGKTLNEIVISWHLLEDVLGWAVVLVGAIIIYFTGWNWVDPFLAVGISAFILYNILKRLFQIVRIFLQHTPPEIDLDEIEKRLLAYSAIKSVHHLHLWSLDGEEHVLTVHAVIPRDSTREDYFSAKNAIRSLSEEFHLGHITAEVEYEDEDCPMHAKV